MMKRILFIEDEKFFLEELQIALADYEITPAYSAPSGMELVQSEDFDAVLLDIMMPPPDDMNPECVDYGRSTGVELCRRIKNLKPELPIVVLTVVRDPVILERIKEAGATKVINKPVPSSVVSASLDEVYFRLARIYEVDSPYRDLEKALKYYRLVYDLFPESLYVDEAEKRIKYLNRHFFLIQ